MTASSETAPGKMNHYISSPRIKPTARRLEFVRDALIDTYGCMLIGDLTITDIETGSWQRDDVKQMIAKTSVRGFTPKRPELNYDPEQLRAWLQAENIHTLLTPLPVTSNGEKLHK